MKRSILFLTLFTIGLSANSFHTTHKIRVVSATPIYKTVVKEIPYTRCYDKPVRHYETYSTNTHNGTLGTLIGGVAGGILGHQVGGGSGKTVATIGGAIVGTMVGHNLSNQRAYRPAREYITHQEVCTTEYQRRYSKQFVGYKNIAYYKGRKIVKISPRKQHYIRIHKSIRY